MTFVSIVMPSYNSEAFVRQAIESVLAQSYQQWELLFQDDCSTDRSYEIACEYATKDERIKVERNERNSGAAVTRNRAIERSSGDYLAFLDSDDLWEPTKLERQLAFMEVNDCDFSFTQYRHINEAGQLLKKQTRVVKHLSYKKMLYHCFTGCLTVVYKQDVSHKIYGADVKNCNDYALFLQVLKQSRNAMGLDECLAYYRIRPNSISRNKIHKIKPYIKVLHEQEKLPLVCAYFYMLTNLIIKVFYKHKRL